jgi:hypothetical protein
MARWFRRNRTEEQTSEEAAPRPNPPAYEDTARPEVLPLVRGVDMVEQWGNASQLQSEGRLADALQLAFECTEAARLVGWRRISPSWAWDTAVLARKLRRFDLEVQTLEGYLAVHPPESKVAQKFPERLSRARELDARNS